MTDISKEDLREMCDKFQTGRGCICAPWVTRFDDDNTELVSDLAKLALDSYNQTERKNFKLEKVCKLNGINIFFCMTFRACDAETDECRLFRGVVALDDVMLCEIMDGDTIKGVGNHVAASSRSKEAHSPRTRKHGRSGSEFAVNDNSGGSSDGVNQWSLAASDVEDGVMPFWSRRGRKST